MRLVNPKTLPSFTANKYPQQKSVYTKMGLIFGLPLCGTTVRKEAFRTDVLFVEPGQPENVGPLRSAVPRALPNFRFNGYSC